MFIRVTTCLFGALLLLALAPPAEATTACFDWDCSSSGPCTFDAGCSSWSGGLWRFRWDFGDGSDLYFTGSEVTTHEYSSGCYFEVELLVIPWSDDPASVTCEIIVENCFGPPQPEYGRCSS